MGKGGGKTLLSIIGFAVGMGPWGMAAFGTTSTIIGGLMGASLFGNIWNATNKPKNNATADYSKFDALQNTISSQSMIPAIYGTRKYGGNQLWHSKSSDGLTLTKDVVISEGEIDSVYDVKYNDLFVNTVTTTKTWLSIKNTKLPSATVVVPKAIANEDLSFGMILNNKQTQEISIPYNANHTIANVISLINSHDGWVATSDYPTVIATNIPPTGYSWETGTSCYSTAVNFATTTVVRAGLTGSSYTMQTGSPTQAPPSNYDVVGGYKNIAWLRATMKASEQLQGSNPTITYVCRGRKVLDTRTGTYAHSSNPAMCFRDFLLNKRFGAAKFIPGIAELLDEDSFKEIADYCDEQIYFLTTSVVTSVGTIDDNIASIQAQIDSGAIENSDDIQNRIVALQVQRQALINGQSSVDVNIVTFEPRYTLNIIIDELKTLTDVFDEFFASFGGFLVLSNGRISLRCEKKDTVSYAFTNDTIVADSVSIEQLSIDETPNQYKIGYFDSTQNWTQVKVIAEDTVDQQPYPIGRGKVITKEVTLSGCTSQAQAIALGRLYRLKNKLCSRTITFKTTSFAMHLQPGDIVTTTYDKVDDDGNPLTVIDAMPWRITEISQESGTYTIKGREYNDSIYGSYADTVTVKDYVPIDSPINDTVPSPSNVVVEEYGWMAKDGNHVSTIEVSWDAVEYQFLRQYIVSYSTDGVTWKSIGTTTPNCVIPAVEVGLTYDIKVQTQNTVGRTSTDTVKTLTVIGKDNAPDDVTAFSVSQASADIIATLTANDEPDIKHYELRMGYSWENSIFIDTMQTKLTFAAPSEGTLTFWVKAVDNFGNYSANAVKATVNIFGLPEKNVILTVDEDATLWNPKNMYWWNNAWKMKSKEVLGDYALLGDIFGNPLTFADAYIDLPVIDLGENVVETDAFYMDGDGNTKIKSVELLGDYALLGDIFGITLTLQTVKYISETFLSLNVIYNEGVNTRVDIVYSTSVDGVTWSSWYPSTTTQFFGRYLRIRLVPVSVDGVTNVLISGMTTVIDVNDVENIIGYTVIPAETTHITFKQKFFAVPKSYYFFTSDAMGTQATNRVTNVTTTGLDIDILDSSGNNIAGIIQQGMIRGY